MDLIKLCIAYKFPSNKYINYEFTFNVNWKYSKYYFARHLLVLFITLFTWVMLTSLEKPSSLLCCMTEQEDCSCPHSAEIPCTLSSNTRSRSPLEIYLQYAFNNYQSYHLLLSNLSNPLPSSCCCSLCWWDLWWLSSLTNHRWGLCHVTRCGAVIGPLLTCPAAACWACPASAPPAAPRPGCSSCSSPADILYYSYSLTR